jgi:hypothetical protein
MYDSWFEVWVDKGLAPPYLLLVVPTVGSPVACRIIDPQESAKIVYDAQSYDAARLWLLDDEYEQIGERATHM